MFSNSNTYETKEWKFSFRVGVLFKFYLIQHDNSLRNIAMKLSTKTRIKGCLAGETTGWAASVMLILFLHFSLIHVGF